MHSLILRRYRLATWAKALAVLLFAVGTALSAQVKIWLPFSPVPLTLQVLLVVLSGLVLGARGALLAQILYLQAILMGGPFTASGLGGPTALLGATAGYLWAFPIAAGLAGWVSHRTKAHGLAWRLLAGLLALTIIYASGMGWLAHWVGGVAEAWRLGVVPFVGADLFKVVLAAAALSVRRR